MIQTNGSVSAAVRNRSFMEEQTITKMKYEFDSFEEVLEAMKHLSDYHDCEKCHNKIVAISTDGLGNSTCGYCGQVVKYPKLSKKGFEKEREKYSLGEKEGV